MKHSYQYDALDRIEKETVEPEPTPFTVPIALMTYDADDRLDTFNGQTCLSDLDGNLVTGPLGGNVTGFTFDARNRLTEVGNATFAYDSEGRRVSKTENGTTTTYVHDPQSPLSRLLSATNGNTSTFYVYTPAGMMLFEDTPSTTGIRVPHHDYRGSTVALSNGTGSVIGRVTYGTYGEVVSRTGDTDTRFLYHGAYGVETDANGLCLMRARYYSPQTRRFLNADPIQFGGGVNWYMLTLGNPVMRIDPRGLDWNPITNVKRALDYASGERGGGGNDSDHHAIFVREVAQNTSETYGPGIGHLAGSIAGTGTTIFESFSLLGHLLTGDLSSRIFDDSTSDNEANIQGIVLFLDQPFPNQGGERAGLFPWETKARVDSSSADLLVPAQPTDSKP